MDAVLEIMDTVFMTSKLMVIISMVLSSVLSASYFLRSRIYNYENQGIDEVNESFDVGKKFGLICLCLTAVYCFGDFACFCTCLVAVEFYLLDMLSGKKKYMRTMEIIELMWQF